MGSNALPYIETKPKLIFFTDFDGTITVDDITSLRLITLVSAGKSALHWATGSLTRL
ncbi:Pyridoxal phosphate phosphatase-related [Penicillium camemberti]|uniref:Pyridoxal phosphate phosphatase-related n=1 Tax=Penicillium camemberti (strain FM 013) TaxID=1429867 RepID=A0A0G4P4I9_PENC3|nr:Pyridoxal phosphate phosphatase-related [Penicillium camemberti]